MDGRRRRGRQSFEHVRKKGDDWSAHSSERRCHWLPYLKEMRRAEEGGTGRKSRRVKKERKNKGNVISHGDCPKVSLSFK